MRFRSKSMAIEAFKYNGGGFSSAWPSWLRDNAMGDTYEDTGLVIKSPGGWTRVQAGHWVIKEVSGGIYSIRPDLFDAIYEPAHNPYDAHHSDSPAY